MTCVGATYRSSSVVSGRTHQYEHVLAASQFWSAVTSSYSAMPYAWDSPLGTVCPLRIMCDRFTSKTKMRGPRQWQGRRKKGQMSDTPDSSSSLRSARSSFAIVSARSSKIRCLTPSLSYSRERNDPCIITCVPFKSVLAYSASLPKVTTRCQSVRLCHSPLSFFHDSCVATDKVVTAVPFAVK